MKLAVCFTPDRPTCLATVEQMAQAQVLYESQAYQIFEVRHGAMAHITTSECFSAVPLLRYDPQGNVLMISGVPIDLHGSLEQTLQTIITADYRTAARSLSALDGAFAAVFWDNQHRKLVVVTDFLGMQPLYIVHQKELLLLATELKGLGASGQVALEPEPAGWGAFLSFGHFIGPHTSLKAARRVDALRQSVHGYMVHNPRGTALLSGGFDSRLILALLHQSHAAPRALILRHQNQRLDADRGFATRIAKQFHIDYELVTPQKSHFSSAAYLDYLVMNEVATPSLYLFIAQVSAYIQPDMQAVWEGVFPGCTLTALSQPPGGVCGVFEASLQGVGFGYMASRRPRLCPATGRAHV